ncbi:hypothetical protein KPH14_000940, partial [Odynerus spinipes]
MEEYVSESLTLAQKLRDIGSPIDDKLVGVIMLAGLPSEYKPMVIALENSGAVITTDLVKNKLLQETIKKQTENRSSEGAFTAKTEKKNYNKYNKKFQRVRCYGCGEEGHKKPDCKRNRPVFANKGYSKENKDVNQSKHEKDKQWNLLSALTTKINNNDWYIHRLRGNEPYD